MGSEFCEGSAWLKLPDVLLLRIFGYFKMPELLLASKTCKKWLKVSQDEFLWKYLLVNDFHITSQQLESFLLRRFNANSGAANAEASFGQISWQSQYRRLTFKSPILLSQTIREHVDEVLHVSFAPNGRMFSTTSKDGFLKIFTSKHPCKLMADIDLKLSFRWRYTQYSAFSSDSRLILVSGACQGGIAGEIAVYEVISEHQLLFRCRVSNKPYDIFGCWFDSQHLLNGELNVLGNLVSSSEIWLCKASQEAHTERIAVVSRLLKFLNRNGSTVRMITLSHFVSRDVVTMCSPGTTVSSAPSSSKDSVDETDGNKSVNHGSKNSSAVCCSKLDVFLSGQLDNHVETREASDGLKLLIFTTGDKTYTPHQVGFKLIRAENALGTLQSEVMPPERLAEINERLRRLREESNNGNAAVNALPNVAAIDDPDWWQAHYQFEKPDHVIDLYGHIVGIALSSDHRYLFVNLRPWPTDMPTIADPWDPPPIAEDMQIRVIGLTDLTLHNRCYLGHKAFTPNDDCFFIFLDSNDAFLASGSEDSKAYVWDLDIGCVISQLPHKNVVNSVCFNPQDSEMLVTVSDDHTINVWRSRRRIRQLNMSTLTFPE